MIEFKAQGEYEFRVHGGPRDGLLLNRSKNLITDYGLDWYVGNIGSYYYYQSAMVQCYVGTGTTAPAATDLILVSKKMGTATVVTDNPASGNVTVQTDATTRYYELERVFRFAAATENLNLTEVGVGPDDTTLTSRALIVDGGGNPTSITLLTGEQLDVTYRVRMTAPTKDLASASAACGTGSVDIGGVTYNYTVYLFDFGPNVTTSVNCTWPGQLAGLSSSLQVQVTGDPNLTFPEGAWQPSVTVGATRTKVSAGKVRLTYTLPLGHATTGVGRMWLRTDSGTSAFVFQFDKKIPKDGDSTLKFDVDFQVTRG